MIEAVFFDAGETLLSPKPSWSELMVEVLRERGHEVTVDAVRGAWRANGEVFVKAAEDGERFSLSADASERFWTRLYTDLLAHVEIDDEDAPKALYETFTDPERYGLFDDALPALRTLRDKGLVLGVISNFEGWLKALLDVLGIRELFQVVAVSGDLGVEKPDGAIFDWAMSEAGVEARSSLHVGDSPHFDAQPAHDLGMTGVLLDRHGRWVNLEAPYPMISTLGELAGVVESR